MSRGKQTAPDTQALLTHNAQPCISHGNYPRHSHAHGGERFPADTCHSWGQLLHPGDSSCASGKPGLAPGKHPCRSLYAAESQEPWREQPTPLSTAPRETTAQPRSLSKRPPSALAPSDQNNLLWDPQASLPVVFLPVRHAILESKRADIPCKTGELCYQQAERRLSTKRPTPYRKATRGACEGRSPYQSTSRSCAQR